RRHGAVHAGGARAREGRAEALGRAPRARRHAAGGRARVARGVSNVAGLACSARGLAAAAGESQVNGPVAQGLAATAVPPVATQVPVAKPHGEATPAGPGSVARVAVLGASGYSGHEFVRLARAHPGPEIAALVSREYAGRPARERLPGGHVRVTRLPS